MKIYQIILSGKSSKKQSILIEQAVKPYNKRNSINKAVVQHNLNRFNFKLNEKESEIFDKPQL